MSPHSLRRSFATNNSRSLGLELQPDDLKERLRHKRYETVYRNYVLENPLLQKMRRDAVVNRQKSGGNEFAPAVRSGSTADLTMPEREALSAVRARFPVTWRALRAYCEKNHHAARREGKYFYSYNFVNDLVENWVTKQRVMLKRNISRSRFFYWAKEKMIAPIVIGKVSLVPLSALMKDFRDS